MYNFNVGKAQEPPPATKKRCHFAIVSRQTGLTGLRAVRSGEDKSVTERLLNVVSLFNWDNFALLQREQKKKTKATARTTRPSVTDLGGDVRLLGGFCASSLK